MKYASYLLFSTASGVLALLGLLAFCFAIVHFFILASLGRKFQKQSNAQRKCAQAPTPTQPQSEIKNENKEKQNSSQTPEPIYYIVERKRRTKASFSEPKRIKFNKE
jgi:hypothetical protein